MTPRVDLDHERRSTRKRKAILQAAATLFLRNGYLGTSMDEIAALAGVSKQTVYKHFGDKQELLLAIVNDALDATVTMRAPDFNLPSNRLVTTK